jgi:hypothetical protein
MLIRDIHSGSYKLHTRSNARLYSSSATASVTSFALPTGKTPRCQQLFKSSKSSLAFASLYTHYNVFHASPNVAIASPLAPWCLDCVCVFCVSVCLAPSSRYLIARTGAWREFTSVYRVQRVGWGGGFDWYPSSGSR